MEPIHIALIISLIISVILHEMAHGYAANWLGDPTARLAGRLTANPLPHIDPLMSVVLPGLLILTSSPILFGAAKPVPYNPYNLSNQKWGEAIVAAAGPVTNIIIALIFGFLIRGAEVLELNQTFIHLSVGIIMINIFLAFFNLVPIPPLDGSKILSKLLPFSLSMKYEGFRAFMEHNVGMAFLLVIIIFVFLLSRPLLISTVYIASLFTGLGSQTVTSIFLSIF